jgi:hypothetical protein
MKQKTTIRKPSRSAEKGATVVIIIITAILMVVIGISVLDFLSIVKF